MLVGGSSKLVTLLCGIFTAAVIIMYSIATAGMTKSTAPLVNLQVGTADIHKLDVNKVVPQASNVLHFLGGAMNAQSNVTDELFGTLKEISNTTHLRSLLMLLVNGRSYQTTIHALNKLTPIALESDEESVRSMKGLYQVMLLSNDQNKTIDGLQTILAASSGASASNSSQGVAKNSSASASVVLQSLLVNSPNPVAIVSDLVKLGSLGGQKASQLAPYMSLLGQSNNISQTVESLNDIVNANVTAEATSQLLSQLGSSSDPSAALVAMAKKLPAPQATVVRALISLLGTFPNPDAVFGVLTKSNGTDVRETLHAALPVFTDLSTNSYNVTVMINNVQKLMASSDANSAATLKGLQEVLESSKNQEATLAAVSALTSSPIKPSTAKAVPPLFSLLKDSNNITDSFSSLLDITSFALTDRKKFTPLVRIVNAAASDEDEIFIINQHGDVVERMFDYLDIPTDYRLGIFNLCALRVDGTVKSCTKKRSVQDFDFRNIIYSHLKDSDIYPYLVALNIGPDDLYLEGRMLHKQHMYVPAMRALLAFQLLTLIFAFALFVVLAVKFSDSNFLSISGTITKILAIPVAVFGLLSALIAAIITAVIKNGTGHDNYGVVYKGGSGFTALQWISVCLAIITATLLWVTVTPSTKVKNGDAENAHVSESDEELTKEPKIQA